MSKYNSFISDGYIDSALTIRKAFLNLDKDAAEHEDKVSKFSKELIDSADELERYKDSDFDGVKDLNKLKEEIVSKFNDIEDKIANMNNTLEPLKKRREELEKEESRLLDILVDKYPQKSLDDIVEELFKHII